MSESRIETFKGADDLFYNRVIAANNEVLMLSEGYPDMGTAKDNIAALEDAFADMKEAEDGDADAE
jgi:uncharacterized protein YegP (UPF0339 family)